MAHIGEGEHSNNQDTEQHSDPAGRADTFVMIRLLRTRYVWRNAHSASSEVAPNPAMVPPGNHCSQRVKPMVIPGIGSSFGLWRQPCRGRLESAIAKKWRL